MSAGVTCERCHGRIDKDAHDMKRRLFARLHPTKKLSEYTPPKICSECWWVATVRLCYSDDEILNSTPGESDE